MIEYFFFPCAVQDHGLDRKALAQLTQLNMCASLECTFYQVGSCLQKEKITIYALS